MVNTIAAWSGLCFVFIIFICMITEFYKAIKDSRS